MFKFKCRGTLEDLLPLIRLGNIFGLTSIVNPSVPKAAKYYKYYSSSLLSIILVSATFSFWGRINDVYPLLPVTISLVDGISLIVLTLTNVLSIYNLCVSSRGSSLMEKFFEGMSCVDIKLSKYCSKMSIRIFYAELIVGHIFVVSFYIYDGYIWITYLGISRFRSYIFRSLQNYMNFLTMLMIRYFVISLEIRFRGLNAYINEYSRRILFAKEIYIKEDVNFSRKPIAQIYNALCDQVRVFNQIYGLPALLLSLYFISETLMSLMLSIIYFFRKNKSMAGASYGMDLFWLCFFWIVKDFVSYLKIIAPCDATISEAKRVAIVCYKLLQETSEKSTFRQKNLRSELALVALQSSTTTPSFSAAGFFTVDFTTFFALMGFVTSYLVVLIQFN